MKKPIISKTKPFCAFIFDLKELLNHNSSPKQDYEKKELSIIKVSYESSFYDFFLCMRYSEEAGQEGKEINIDKK